MIKADAESRLSSGDFLGNLSGGIPVDSPPLTSKEPDIGGWPIEAIMAAVDVACWCFRQFLLIHAIE